MNSNSEAISVSQVIPGFFKQNHLDEILEVCAENRIKYADPQFRPTIHSLNSYGVFNDQQFRWRSFEWARATDVLGEDEYNFLEYINPSFLRQGDISDCFLICAMVALAERPQYVKRLFETIQATKEGIYVVWINIGGEWRQITVDDFFPITNHGNACEFSFCVSTNDEIWPMILEKAYAKASGCYAALSAGSTIYALRDLTGAPYEIIDNISEDCDELWKIIKRSCDQGFIIVSYNKSNQQQPSTNPSNETGSVFTPWQTHNVVAYAEVNDSYGRPAKLLLIRDICNNNIGKESDWSERGELWTPEIKQQLCDFDKSECLHWLSLQEFIMIYSTIAIFQINPSYTYNSVKVTDQGEKHLIRFDVEESGEYTCAVDQHVSSSGFGKMPAQLSQPTTGSNYSHFRILIAKLGASAIEFKACNLSGQKSIFCPTFLEPGSYVALIDSYWNAYSGVSTKEFVFSVYGPGRSALRVLRPNDGVFISAQYEVWRDFAVAQAELFSKKGTYVVGEGFNTATICKHNLQDMQFGININRWDHERGSAVIIKGFRCYNVKGLEPITESGSGCDHFVTLNPGCSNVEIFRLDPRQKEFALQQKNLGVEIFEGAIPVERSVRGMLLAIQVDMPAYGGLEQHQDRLYPNAALQQASPGAQSQAGARQGLLRTPKIQPEFKQAPPRSLSNSRPTGGQNLRENSVERNRPILNGNKSGLMSTTHAENQMKTGNIGTGLRLPQTLKIPQHLGVSGLGMQSSLASSAKGAPGWSLPNRNPPSGGLERYGNRTNDNK